MIEVNVTNPRTEMHGMPQVYNWKPSQGSMKDLSSYCNNVYSFMHLLIVSQ